MKAGIETGDLRQVGIRGGGVSDCCQIVRLVHRRGRYERFQVRHQRAGDTCRSDVMQPAMDHAVPDALDCDAVAVVFESVK